MLAKIKSFFKFLSDLIYKRKCINCGCSIVDEILCKNCSKLVQNLPCFAQGLINEIKVYSAYEYTSIIKKMIYELKFKHNKAIANYMGELAYKYLIQLKDEINLQNSIILPVMTSKNNVKLRGYDNVYEIAKVISNLSDIELNKDAIIRIKQGNPQYKLTASQRKKNLVDAFSLNPEFKCNKTIIIFDDLMTTGATLEVLIDLLKERGFYDIVCFTFAKTMRKKF